LKNNKVHVARIKAQLIIVQDLFEDAKSLGINVSKYRTRLNKLEKMESENIHASITTLMNDLSKEIEAFKLLKEKVITSKLDPGISYLLKDELEKGFKIFADQILLGREGLCITREMPRRKSEGRENHLLNTGSIHLTTAVLEKYQKRYCSS
jgi:hypothetical protein